ncbi:hypothetical protein C2S53_019615 [Perilla frutescens var. hirtella]|uniref:Uncharacterized protein n=1 Tax=Perilla frutescens var. hirtella TaxID=608512 RepID=A0AAD4ILP8_PERFH|nr:hypothetical protein C2S53_019615 [Perilla frutescens var. hirtella]
MYEAALENNWEAARVLLEGDRNLAYEEITEAGDRALHVAISMKHTDFAESLIELMNPCELELQDGQGYTACCYAAIMGIVEVARSMIYKNENLLHLRNLYGTTPLELAVSYGTAEMARLLLLHTNFYAFSREEWFGLFLVSVHSKMFGVVAAMLERDPCLAVMKGDDGRTALHVLAQLDISSGIKLHIIDLH